MYIVYCVLLINIFILIVTTLEPTQDVRNKLSESFKCRSRVHRNPEAVEFRLKRLRRRGPGRRRAVDARRLAGIDLMKIHFNRKVFVQIFIFVLKI
jgi:hypothetical protein